MQRFAERISDIYSNELKLTIPSKCESRIRPLVKWVKFRASIRLWRLGIETLPAIALDGEVLCEGKIKNPQSIEARIKKILKNPSKL
jgi:hypothetical protein